MKKFITLCITAAMLGSATGAEARVTLREAQQMLKEGTARKQVRPVKGQIQSQNSPFRTAGKGISRLNQVNALPLSKKKAPSKVTAGGSDVFGYCTFSESMAAGESQPGLYELMPSGLELKWYDPIAEELGGYTFVGGYVKDGVLKGYIPESLWGMVFGVDFGSVNFETGENLGFEVLDLATAPIYDVFTYSPAEDKIYGFGTLQGYENPVFMYSEESNPSYGTVIAEITEFSNMPVAVCYNQNDNAIYGIDGNLNFTKYDVDGTITPLFSIAGTGAGAGYYGGLVYAPAEDLYYFAFVNGDTYEAGLATINATAQNAEVIESYPDTNQFRFLLCTNDYVVNKFAPKRPVVSEVGFPAGSLSGYVSFQMPDSFAGGDPIIPEDVIDVYVSLDGEPYVNATAKAGEIYSATFDNLSEGKHKFSCYVSVAGVNSSEVSVSKYIGNDTPLAPANVVLTNQAANWDAVPSEGVNKGYVNIDQVEYVVYLNGEEYGRTKECILPVVLPADKPLELYKVEVVAVFDGKSSQAGVSNGVVAGQPLELPVSIAPTAAQAALCSTYDGTNNGAGWKYYDIQDSESGVFQVGYAPADSGDQDQWLFMPAISIKDASKYYTLNYQAAIRSANYPDEYLSVYVGTAPNPEAMTTEVVEEYTPAAGVYEFVESYFQVPAAGTYYVGFHCTSAEDQYGISLMDINIVDENITAESPAAVYNLDAVGADQGVLKATVNFNLPTKNMGGEELAADAVVKATIVAANTVTVEGKPGEKVSVEVETVQSENIISVRPSIGELNGPVEKVTVYTGVEVPNVISDLQSETAPDMMSMKLSWTAPTEGYEGGYINPETVTYDIYKVEATIFGDSWVLYQEGITDTTYTYECEPGAVQELVQIGVVSVNEAGDCGYLLSASDVLGTPWELPMNANFDDGTLPYGPWMIYQLSEDESNMFSWAFGQLGQVDSEFENPENYALIGTPASETAVGRIGLPRFTTNGYEGVTVDLNLYVGDRSCEYTIYAFEYGSDLIEIGKVSGHDAEKSFEDYSFQLPAELLGKAWVGVYVDVKASSAEDIAIIDSVDVSGTSTGINSAINSSSIFGGKNTITVRGLAGSKVTISSVNGAVIANGIADSNEKVYKLEKGVYVVKAGDRKAKVLVK